MLAEFALLLIAGISAMLCLMPRAHVASGFFRVLMLVLLGLNVLLALTADSTIARVAAALMAVVAFVGSALWMLERRRGGEVLLYVLGVVSLIELICFALTRDPTAGRAAWVFASLATAGTLGGTMTAMLLGHRYLTAPGMPLSPLHALNAWLGGAVLLRALVSAVLLFVTPVALSDPTVATWLVLRWLAGIGGPAVAVVLVWRILRYRNTQSATGVLFAAVVLAFIGELAAALLARQVHSPL